MPIEPQHATDVIAEFFADRAAKAQAEVDKAQAALDHAEHEALGFEQRGELPGGVPFDLCVWVTSRAARVGFRNMTHTGDSAARKAEAEQRAVFAWLETNGYEVPDAYRSVR